MVKGQLSVLALGVILALTVLFVGIYMISKISYVMESDMYDYTTTDVNNNTALNLTASAGEKTLTIGTLATINGEALSRYLFIEITNGNATVDATITTYLNGTSLGTFTAGNNSVTNHTFTGFSLTSGGPHNITVTESGVAVSTVSLNRTNLTYESGRSTATTTFGSVYAGLASNTATIVDVVILAVIIVSLGVAIAVLRGFGGTAASEVGGSV